jgi:PPOX class probable F420-dependent enzyme
MSTATSAAISAATLGAGSCAPGCGHPAQVDERDMRRLAASARVGRLGTVGSDGRPHLVPVCFVLLGGTVYSAVDHKPKRSTRLRRLVNVEATGQACLLVDRYSEDWSMLWWVRLDGRARVVDDPAEAARAVAALVDKYPQYAEQPPAGPVLALEITQRAGWSAS